MKVQWIFNQPRTFGLKSGASLYCLQRGQELYISGYDWFNSKSLQPWKNKYFKVLDDSDDQPDNPKIMKKEEIQADKPKPKPENQPETLKMDRFGTLSTTKMTNADKAKKVVKKHIKKKSKDVIIS
ncbi:MAG: hypothetical protein R3213_08195 [Flavobacteriaceae bacterium]|nr:hypothetical protein [Flavobacteriaceae bacterium]